MTANCKKWVSLDQFRAHRLFLFLLACWLVVILICGLVRPFFPSNELRYVSVAWEMWAHHSFIVPLQGALPYPHKPPLLFWLVHGGWWIFGVNSWWPRLVPELFGLASLYVLYLMGQNLWPQQLQIARLAPIILMGMLGWLSQLDLFKFDIMVSFFVLCSIYFLLQALSKSNWFWWLLSLSIALGVLTKGPVCLLFILPAMILLPIWHKNYQFPVYQKIYYKMLVSLLIACGLIFLWAGPAAWLGGKSYTKAIFWHQSAGRMAGEFGGIKHWYAYFEFLLWLLFPWSLWFTLWRGLFRVLRQWRTSSKDWGIILLFVIITPAFIFLSFIPVKSERYIIPLLPWFALFFAFVLVKTSSCSRRYDQLFISIIYLGLGALYLFLPYIPVSSFQQRFFWIHELSPVWGLLFIALAIILALFKNQDRLEPWKITTISIMVFVVYNLGWVKIVAKHNDLRPMAKQLYKIENQGAPIALYQSDFEFEFFGRLQHPSTLLYTQKELNRWLKENPQGWVVSVDGHVYPKQFILKPASQYLQAQLLVKKN